MTSGGARTRRTRLRRTMTHPSRARTRRRRARRSPRCWTRRWRRRGAPSSAGAAAVQIVLVRGALTDKVLDAAVKSRLSPGRLKTASMCRVAGDLHRRAEGFASRASPEATESETSTEVSTKAARSIARRLRRKLAAHVLRQLEDDGDDLYFEGVATAAILDAVGVGAASAR